MKKKVWIAVALGTALAGWLLWGNSALQVSHYRIADGKLPAGFQGFRIAQVSDLHNTEFGRENEKLLARLREESPDLIVITGDLVDSRNTDFPTALSFAEQAAAIAPCYYVTGNHEARLQNLPDFLSDLETVGVTVLRNETVTLERNGDSLTLMGLDDPSFLEDYRTGNNRWVLTQALEALTGQDRGYTILLSHRPEWLELYRAFGMNLVFSGHAHGGQFRLPFVGGLAAPNQGFFPAYTAGVIREGETAMVVSRGLGPSIIPLRVNNRPELVVTELYRED